MSYKALLRFDGALDVFHGDRSEPDISYPAGSITSVRIHLSSLHEGGLVVKERRVAIHARMDRPDRVIQTFSFNTGAEAEGFYGDVLRILGWT